MRRAQFTVEYAILLAIVVAALLAIAVYLQRSVSGKWREAADAIGFGRQYDYGVSTGG